MPTKSDAKQGTTHLYQLKKQCANGLNRRGDGVPSPLMGSAKSVPHWEEQEGVDDT